MLKLSEIRKTYEDLTGKLSDINHQLCFAGFGIIWIFNKTGNETIIPSELYEPAVWLVISLAIDVIQYVYSSIAWAIYYTTKRKRNKNDDKIEVDEPTGINYLTWILFSAKVITMCIGFYKIGFFLISKL